jgi:hypothetical protein
MAHHYLYPRQRQIEVGAAIYALGMGVYVGLFSTIWGMSPLSWMHVDPIILAELLVTASMVWAVGIRINGAWWGSPFLRLAGMLSHLGVALWAIFAGAGSSASYTYGWVAALLFIGARNAAKDCAAAWGRKWAKQI